MRTNPARWLMVVLLIGCGGSAPPADDSDDEASDETSGDEEEGGHQRSARELLGINPPEKPWEEMTHEEREMDMIGRFNPIFTEYFQEHDAEEYADFSCQNCHGPDMRETNFRMPSAHLPPVAAPDSDAYRAMTEENPEMMRFMEQEVQPAMQTMLGKGDAFTCNGCHPGVEPPRGRRGRRARRGG